jgi:predicted dehydrogenase
VAATSAAEGDTTMRQASSFNRREFLAATAAGVAVSSFSLARAQGANDRIGVGFIGAGGRSESHMSMVRHLRDEEKMPIDLVAVCDVYRPRLERRKQQFGITRGYMDHRELLADKDVDVVCIATPDHLHGYQAIDAIQAGKDVYCEKPVTHWRQFELTRRLADVVAGSDRVFQLGTQAMSDVVWRQMKKLVQEGLIGQPLMGEAGFFRVGDWGERGMPVDDPAARPGPDLNWEAFLGDSPKREFSVDRFFRWRLFSDYAGGPVTDLYPHSLTQVVDILGVGFPSEVVAVGGIHRYPYELRDVPDTFHLLAQYPEKVTISVLGTQANDYQTTEVRGSGQRCPVIRGFDGTLTIEKNQEIVFTPLREKDAKMPRRIPIEGNEDNVEHWRNLLDCCRTRQKATWSPMDLAFRTQTVLHMASLAMRAGKTARFDAAKREIVI